MRPNYYISKAWGCFLTLATLLWTLYMPSFAQNSCPAVWLPLSEHFDTTDSLPECWERWENFDEAAMKAHIVSTPVLAGSGALMISSGSGASTVHRTVVRARTLSQSPQGIRLTLNLMAQQMGSGDVAVLVVGVCNSTSINFTTNFDFDTVQVIQITTPNVWNSYDVDFSSYSGTGDRIAFLMSQPMQTGTGHRIYMDEISMERCRVEGGWVSHRAADELTLHWTTVGACTSVTLTATPAGNGTPLTFSGVESPYHLTGLDPSTTYTFTLTPHCTGEQLPGATHVFTGSTLAGPHYGLMYCEDFESYALPDGWTAVNGATIGTSQHYDGSRAMQVTTGGNVALPIIALADSSVVPIGDLTFSTMLYATTAAARVEVKVGNYPEEDSLLTTIGTLVPSATGQWVRQQLPTGAYSGSARYVVLKVTGGTVWFDALQVGRCLLEGVRLTEYTSTSATIGWDAPAWSGQVTIEPIVPAGTAITAPAGPGASNSITIPGLTPATYYSYSVYGSCDNPCNATEVSFNTFAAEYTLPYCTDFESSGTLPTDWQTLVGYNNNPRIVTGQPHSGTRSLRFSAAGGVSTGNYTLVLLPPLPASTMLTVSLAAHSDYSGVLEVGTVSDAADAASFTAAGNCTLTGDGWARSAVSCTLATGSRIALRYYHSGSGERTAYVDDLEVSLCGVSGVTAYGERAEGATIAWSSTCDSVDVQYRKRGTAATVTVIGATSPLVLDSLDQGSTYDYYLRCTEEGLQGCWIYGGSFTTLAGALMADYCHPATISTSAATSLWSLPYLEETSYTGLLVSFTVSGSGTYEFGLLTQENNVQTFTAIGGTRTATSTPSRVSVALSGHETHGHYIALRRISGNQTFTKLRLSRGNIVSFTVDEVTATTAVLSWTTEGTADSVTVTYQASGQSPQQVTVAGNGTTLTGLTPGSSYSFSLTVISSGSHQSCTNDEGSFVTLANDLSDGWCEDFNTTSTSTLPTGWTAVAGQPAVNYYSTTNRLLMNSTANSSCMVALPYSAIDFAQTPMVLRVEAVCTSSNPEASMLIAGVMSNRNNANTFVPTDTIHPTGTAHTYLLDLSGYSGNGHVVALRYVSPSASRNLYLDNFALGAAMVANPTASEVTNHSVHLSWEGATSVTIQWNGGSTTATGNSTTIDSLAAGTQYTFTIYATGQTAVCQQLTVTVRTLEEPTVAPMCYGFETNDGTTSLPYGWTRLSGNYPTGYYGTSHSGSRSLRFYTTSGGSDMAVSPMFENTTFSDWYVSFYAYTTSTASTMQVGTMADPNDASTFVACGSVTVGNGGWRRYEVSLASSPATHRYLALRHTATSSSYVYVDDLMLRSCPMPTATIQHPTTNSLEVRWSGATSDVMIEWYRTGYSSGHNTVTVDYDGTSQQSHTLTGLIDNTDYTVLLWPVCSDSESAVCHYLTLNDHTLPLPLAIPYCQQFGSGLPSAWFVHSASGGSVTNSNNGYVSYAVQMQISSQASSFASVTLPQFNVSSICADMDSVYLELRVYRTGTGVLQLGIMHDVNDSSDFVAFRNIDLSTLTSGSWQLLTLKVPVADLVSGMLALRLIHSTGSTATATVRIDDVCVRHCMAKNVALTESTPTSVTFTWESYGAEGLLVTWNGGSYYATTSPFTITGLNPNANYTFSFTAQCPCNITSQNPELITISRRMPAAPMTMLPICYNFENYSNNGFPYEWRRSNGTYPRVNGTMVHWGIRGLELNATASSPLVMSLQPLPDSCTHAVVGFYAWCQNVDATENARLQVGLMSNPEDPTTFTPLAGITIDVCEQWQPCFVEINNPAHPYIALRFSPGSGSYNFYIDDLGVTECAVSEISVHGGQLHLAALGNPVAYEVTIENLATHDTRQTVVTTLHTPLSSIGISSDSAYSIEAAAMCDYSGKPNCTPVSTITGIRMSLPYCEEFDNAQLYPYGWEIAGRTSPVYPRQGNANNDSIYYQLIASPDTGNLILLPLLPVGQTLGGLNLWLQMKLQNSSHIGNSYLEIGSYDETTGFTLLATLTNSTLVQYHNINLPPCNGNRLALRPRTVSGEKTIYIDHLQLTVYARPYSLNYTQTSCHLQHIYWENHAGNSQYLVEWGPQGFAAGTGTTLLSDSCHVLLQPTQPNTTYSVRLSSPDGVAFCTPYRFTTLPPSVGIPYCDDINRTLAAGTLFYLPEVDMPLNSLTARLIWRTSANGRLVIGAVTEYQTASTFTPIDTLYPTAANVWDTTGISLSSYADTGRYVAIRFEGATGNLKGITLQSVPQPIFHVISSSEIEAILPDGQSGDYYLRVVPHGAQQPSTSAIHVTTSPYIIGGLTMFTDYDLYVVNSPTGTTCAPSIHRRTHLDIEAPYCCNLGSQQTGWHYEGRYRVMPYVLIDSIDSLHLYFTSRGTITLGVMTALDDTASFVALTQFNTTAYTEHTVHMNTFDTLPGHYIAFRYESTTAAISALVVQRVANPTYRVLSSSEIEVTMADGQSGDFYLRVVQQGASQTSASTIHVTTSPYVIGGLTMYSYYDIYVVDSPDGTTCAPPVTLRTHLDIEAPYCEQYSGTSEGWLTMGSFRMMPRVIVDTMGDIYITFLGRGSIDLGVQSMLDDTLGFVPLASFSGSTWEERVVHLSDYAALVGASHYIVFHGGELQRVYLHTCPLPEATLSAFNQVRFEQEEDGIDYWIRYHSVGGDTLVHATSNPFYIDGLAQNSDYSFSYQCDSATAACIPALVVRTGVRIETPFCVDLGGYRFGLGSLPDGWFAMNGSGNTRYIALPIVNLDSVWRLFARFEYRIAQTGTALEFGVMGNPDDVTTFTPLDTLTSTGGSYTTYTRSLADYRDTGLYIAFRATGSSPQQVYLGSIELQTVPFVDYLLTAYDTVLVVPSTEPSWSHECYITYGGTIVHADSLPWKIGGLSADATYQFNIQATASTAACIAPTTINTTHLASTPLCGIGASLSAAEPLWRGPELAEANVADLRLRMTVAASGTAQGMQLVVGMLRVQNVDSTFVAIDTIAVTPGTNTVSVSFAAYSDNARFLAFMLLPVGSNDMVQLSDIDLEHCFAPQGGHLTLLRYNIVSFDCPETVEWVEYGPAGFAHGTGTTIHITTLPLVLTLAAETTYDFYLPCDSAGSSCADPLSITTLEVPPPLSWCENFDNRPLNQLPPSWRTPTATTTAQEVKVVNSQSHSTARSLYMNATIGHSVVAIMPDLGLDTLNGLSLSMWLYSSNPSTSRLEVGVIFNTSDASTFHPLQTININAANRWERHTIDLRHAPQGAYFIALRCEGSDGLNRIWIDDLHISECGAYGLAVTQVEAGEVTLGWQQTGTPAVSIDVIADSGATRTINIPATQTSGSRECSYTIDNLEPLTNYTFVFNAVCDNTDGWCTGNYTDTMQVFTPAGGSGCIDPTNLAASYTSCFYGNYNNPYANTGALNYGYTSPLSRHTIHYNTAERDPRTGNQLATVPSGAPASVRLGNWTSNSSSPEAESLVYGLSVDTLSFDLLIMRYAAVLQDPDHAASDQPRFSLELLDSNLQLLDPLCGRADFIANWNLGWNIAPNSVLWKDWTTVGIDMTPYAGQTIYIRLTTRDCNEGSHYGYAYFTLECMRKNITTTECGVVAENNLTAPAGFNYSWYTSADTTVFSHMQTITVPSNNYITYLCDNAFVDNPSCVFTMSAFAGVRYPLSLMDYTVSLAPCSFDVQFFNHSTISSDGITPVGTGEGVESARWYFGTGDSATTYNTYYNYPSPGTYNVQLVTGIAGDACLDTLTLPLTLAFPPTGMSISGINERCRNDAPDTLTLPAVVDFVGGSTGWTVTDSVDVGTHRLYTYRLVVDSTTHAVGTHTVSATVTDSVGCTMTLTHSFTVHPTYSFTDSYHICTLLLPYSWRDTAFAPETASGLYTIHRYSQHGCDSVMRVNLNVYDNALYTKRDTMTAAICDNQSYFFSDSLLTPDPSVTHNSVLSTIVYTDSLFSSIGCDSLSTVVLTVHPTYDHHLGDTVCSNQSYSWGTPQRSMYTPWSRVVTHEAADSLLPEAVAPTDTSFTDSLTSVSQCDSLSSLHLHLLPAYHLTYTDEMCDASYDDSTWTHHYYHFEDTVFDVTGTFSFQLSTSNFACDSLRTLALSVHPTHDLHLFDTIYDGDSYSFELATYDTTGIYPHLLATGRQCDSLRTLHLQLNRRTYIDSVVCQNMLPLTWHHVRMSDTIAAYTPVAVDIVFGDGQGTRGASWQVIKDSVHLLGRDDIDSLVVMTLVVRDTSSTFDIVHSCDSLVWMHTPDTTYRTSTSHPFRRLVQLASFDTSGIGSLMPDWHLEPYSVHLSPMSIQCDSVRHLTLTVDYTHYRVDQQLHCDSMQWRNRVWYFRDTITAVGPVGSHHIVGPVDSLLTLAGCDSVISLDLAIRNATYQEAVDTFCYDVSYTWRGQVVGQTETSDSWPISDLHRHYYLTDTLQTHTFYHPSNPAISRSCDSVMAIRLTQMARPLLVLKDSIDCRQQNYVLRISTNVPYSRFEWDGSRHENALGDTFPTAALYRLSVSPAEPYTTYTAYVDYHKKTLCPVTASTTVRPVIVPQAEFRYSPQALRYNDMDFDAYDLTPIRPRSIHPDDANVWRRFWFTDEMMLSDTSAHLTHEIVLAALPEDDRDTVRLTLDVYNGQCHDTVTHLLPFLRVAIFAPNIFTPTEQTNNRFAIVTQGVTSAELFIYNREGLLVFRTDDPAAGWDGRSSSGRLCEQGNYVWKLFYRTIDHPEATRDDVGTVLLIR